MLIEEKKKETLDNIVELVSDSEIASIRNVTSGLIRIINDPNSNAHCLKELIEIDPPLTAKVLRLANSAYYYSRRHISDIEEAVIWIGFENLKEIALHQKVCEIFEKEEEIENYSRELLWRHCVAVAILGKMIYRMEFGERGESVYAAGLLHDIGIITEDQFFTEDFIRILKKAEKDNIPFHEAENEIFGYDHADVGMSICESWQFPPNLITSIAYHHRLEGVPQEHLRITNTLYLANYLCHVHGYDFGTHFKPDRKLFRESLNTLEITSCSVNMIMDKMREEMCRMEDKGFFD